MNQRLTHTLVGIVAGLLVVATLAFAFVATGFSRAGSGAPLVRPAVPSVVHPPGGSMAVCVRCHAAAGDGLPRSHRSFGGATCLTCHRAAPVVTGKAVAAEGDAGPVPHRLAVPYDDCVGCHAIGGNRSMPEDHADATNEDCSDCHAGAGTK